MTYRELNQVFYLRKEIRHIKSLSAKLRADAATSGRSSLPDGDPLSLLLDRLRAENDRLIAAIQSVEEYIERVDDSRTRLLLRLRLIENRSWKGVADGMGYPNSASGCYMWFKRWCDRHLDGGYVPRKKNKKAPE